MTACRDNEMLVKQEMRFWGVSMKYLVAIRKNIFFCASQTSSEIPLAVLVTYMQEGQGVKCRRGLLAQSGEQRYVGAT